MKDLQFIGFFNRISKEIEDEKVFKKGAELVDYLSDKHAANQLASEFKNGKTSKDYEDNIIIAVSNTHLNTEQIQDATSISGMFCDSKKFPIRFLYLGNDPDSFYNEFNKYGLISFVMASPPKTVKPTLKAKTAGA